MITTMLLSASFALSCCSVGSAQTKSSATAALATSAQPETAKPDLMLGAMQAELAREKEQLILPGMQRPFFIEYRLEDIHSYDLVANYGALTTEGENRQRIVRVEVRVGNYVTDSSTSRGTGSLALAPGDDDPAALREALWTATDEAYKAALRAYAAKRAALKQFQNPPTADDFTPAKPVTLVEPLAKLELDRVEWKRRLVEASCLFAKDPAVRSFAADVQLSNASLSALAVNRYTVNTDGTTVRHGYSGYQDSVSVGGQAADGMQLGRNNGSTAVTAAGLESWDSLRHRILSNLESFEALRQAPVVDAEDFHGPVLFSGDAAADVVNRLFVPNIEADRPEIGTSARTQGAYQSSFRSPVLPAFLSVVDDPTLREYEGKTLVGAYQIDDEGEPAQRVTVVERGKLVNYLTGREPVKDFPESNGHGRAALGGAAHPHAGVLVVKSADALTSGQLKAKLLALAKDQGRDVYEVETLGGGELSPRMLYRVSPDGKRTLVRGAVFDELDQRSLRSEILAAGGEPYVAQELSPLPRTTITPALLFADIAVKRGTQQQEKLPYYAPPAVTR
ncbi:MAG: metallopeptidase TldD-related protein [Janthinobacterium lividum]